MSINADELDTSSIKKCIHPWSWMVVTTDGFVRACCVMPGVIGNVNEASTLDELWNGPLIQAVRRDIINGRVPAPCMGASCAYVEGMYGPSVHAQESDRFAISGPVALLRSEDSSYFLLQGPCSCTFTLRGNGQYLAINYALEGSANIAIKGQVFELRETMTRWSSLRIRLKTECTKESKSYVMFTIIKGASLRLQSVSLISDNQKEISYEKKIELLSICRKTGIFNDNWSNGLAEFLFVPTPVEGYSRFAVMLSGQHPFKEDLARMNVQVQVNDLPVGFSGYACNTLYFWLPPEIKTVRSARIRSEVWRPKYVVANSNDARYLGIDIVSVALTSDEKAYAWGSDILMGKGGNARSYLTSGWSVDEDEYTWTEGNVASLCLRTSPPRADLTMHLDTAGFASPKPQIAEVVVNGKPLKKIVLSSTRQLYEIDVPQKYLRTDGLLLIQFKLPNAKSPFELGMSQDKRILSMAVSKLRFDLNQTPRLLAENRFFKMINVRLRELWRKRKILSMGNRNTNHIHEYYVAALVSATAYFIAYLWYPATPGNLEQYFMGWFGWHDQLKYLESARAIAHWELSPATYVYPLGYPLLGVPFLKWLPRHLFFIPNLVLSVGIVLAFYASCRKLISRIESAALTFFLIILSAFTSTKAIAGGLIWSNSLVVPWNVIPVFFAAYLSVWLLIFNKATFRKLWTVSVAIALAVFSRPSDGLFLGVIYLAGLIDLKSIKEKIQGIMILIFPCILVLAIVLISKWIIFGSFLSPYDIIVRDIGFGLYDLPFKFYLIFCDGLPIYAYKELMLLPQMPWLLLCIPGIIFWGRSTNNKSWFLIASIVLSLILYISFNGQAPSNTFNYHGYRYFVWVFPWLGLCAYLTLTRSLKGIGKWGTVAGILTGVLFVLIIGWKEKSVVTISPNSKQSVGEVSELYDLNARRFSGEISLSVPVSADGIRIAFLKAPSINMLVSAVWHKFTLIVDGRKQVLFRDYNLYQSDNTVHIPFRNPINQTGEFQKAVFQYDNTGFPVIDKIYILKKEFKPFGFIERMLVHFGMLPDDYLLHASNLDIIPTSETQHTTGKFDLSTNAMISKRGEGGALMYGPYTLLQPGHYQATYFITAESTVEGAEVGSVDISGYLPDIIDKQLAVVPLKAMRGEQTIILSFDANNPKYLYQFRVWVNGTGDRVSVKGVQVKKLE